MGIKWAEMCPLYCRIVHRFNNSNLPCGFHAGLHLLGTVGPNWEPCVRHIPVPALGTLYKWHLFCRMTRY